MEQKTADASRKARQIRAALACERATAAKAAKGNLAGTYEHSEALEQREAELREHLTPRLWPSRKTADELLAPLAMEQQARLDPWTRRRIIERVGRTNRFRYADNGKPCAAGYAWRAGFNKLQLH